MFLSSTSVGLELQQRWAGENKPSGLQLSCQTTLLPSFTNILPDFSRSSLKRSLQIGHMEEFFSIGWLGQPTSNSPSL